MGADLYIDKLPREAQYRGFEVSADARKAGYFRDCYNDGGLLTVINANTGSDLSWWATQERKELFNKDGDMSVKGAKVWLSELKPIADSFVKLNELYYSEYDLNTHTVHKGERIKDTDVAHYHEWAKGLIEFLELAISLKSKILWSV